MHTKPNPFFFLSCLVRTFLTIVLLITLPKKKMQTSHSEFVTKSGYCIIRFGLAILSVKKIMLKYINSD